MNWLDYLFLSILIGSVIAGAAKGLARMIVGLVATVLGILFACRWYAEAGSYVRDYVSSIPLANALGFFLVLCCFLIFGALVGAVLATAFKWVGLGWMDRLLGAAFGAVRAALVAIVIVLIATAFPRTPFPDAVAESKFAPYVVNASAILVMAAPDELQDAFSTNLNALKKVWTDMTKKKNSLAEMSF